jgi:peptide/nickel transport system ATP-binding protein
MLKGNGLWFRYGAQLVGLMAPSGYGKTTLGKLLAGFLAPTRGQITLDEQPLPI